MKNLVKDASMGPLRDALRQGIEITEVNKEDMRPVTLQVNAMLETEYLIVNGFLLFSVGIPITPRSCTVLLQDFKAALQEVRPSVSSNELGIYEDWNKQFGSLSL